MTLSLNSTLLTQSIIGLIKEQYDAIILANGEFPSNPQIIELLNLNKPIICCDGAIQHLLDLNINPSIIIGDCDSISPLIKNQFKDIIIQIAEQESNDLTKAINYCYTQQYQSILILGATGKREDHTIANIFLLSQYIEQFKSVKILTDYGVFIALKAATTFNVAIGQQISIFNLSNTKITSEGLLYPLANHKLVNLWQGTLNQAIDTKISLNFEHGKILLYLAHEIK